MNVYDLINLKDRVAIVTGASRVLGQAFTVALAEAGTKLCITSLHGSEFAEMSGEIKRLGREFLALESDINNEAQMVSMVNETVKKFGRIDILVNNAASLRIDKAPEGTTLAEWKSAMELNINGVFLCSREAAEVMKK